MNNQIFTRLCSLMKGLGFNAQAGDITTAEMRAYAAGLSMVDELIESAFNNAFIDTADEYGVSMLLALLDLKPGADMQESKTKIINAMSSGFMFRTKHQIQYGFFEHEYAITTYPGEYRFYVSSLGYEIKSFKNLEKILDEVMPAYARVYSAGGYLDFDGLDGVGLHWFEIDDARLPFYAWNAIVGNNYD